jgi:hypothetical protein
MKNENTKAERQVEMHISPRYAYLPPQNNKTKENHTATKLGGSLKQPTLNSHQSQIKLDKKINQQTAIKKAC